MSPKVAISILKSSPKSSKSPKPNFRAPMAGNQKSSPICAFSSQILNLWQLWWWQTNRHTHRHTDGHTTA